MISYISQQIFTIDIGPNMILGFDDGKDVILFDTCIDESVSKKIDKAIGKRVSAIVNSHSHADHIGGNYYFQKKYSTKVYIDEKELSFVTSPELEPALLNGGLCSLAAKDKFLKSKESIAEPIKRNLLLEKGIEVIDLPGHSPSMTGFKIDDTVYLGDAIFSEDIIKKYKVLYLYDADRFNNSLEIIENLPFDRAIISHKGLFDKEEISKIINSNKEHTSEIRSLIFDVANNSTESEILKCLFEKLNINPNLSIYLLIKSTLKGYLSSLQNAGLLEAIFDKGLLWKKR